LERQGRIWERNDWRNSQTVKTVYPSSPDVDIAIFETDERIATPYLIGTTGVFDIWATSLVCRVPLRGIGYSLAWRKLAFIKRGALSAVDSTNLDAIVLYIDGFNNHGFSGGPIIRWDFNKHVYEIVGVVQGYKLEAAKAVVNGQPVDTQILVNSGILVGYSIEHAIKAI
jgi:hypothetical protein